MFLWLLCCRLYRCFFFLQQHVCKLLFIQCMCWEISQICLQQEMGIWEVLFVFSLSFLTLAIFLRLILWGLCDMILVICYDLFWPCIGELGTVQMVPKPIQLCLIRWSHSRRCFSLRYKSSAHTVLCWAHLIFSKWGKHLLILIEMKLHEGKYGTEKG